MNCPIDNTQLVMSERQGIEIDYCPKCRGVWLDRGELDKIIERSAQETPARDASAAREEPRPYRGDDDRYRDDRPRGDDRYYDSDRRKPYRKKKSLLDDIFDF
jgi:uncharacterized protein